VSKQEENVMGKIEPFFDDPNNNAAIQTEAAGG